MLENPLHYLISSEAGAVALLATALAKRDGAEPSKGQLAFWASFKELCDLPLSNTGPSRVEVEHNGADLLARWDKWAILIEAKTVSASIRRGQLQNYYDRFREELGREGILDDASFIAIVFLTPSQVGESEFDKLSVSANDQKRHLYWEQILSLLERSFFASQLGQQEEQTDFFVFPHTTRSKSDQRSAKEYDSKSASSGMDRRTSAVQRLRTTGAESYS